MQMLTAEAGLPAPAPAGMRGGPGQHLLKHAVSPQVQAAAAAEFGADPLVAGTAICKLRQPNLRAVFSKVYGVQTNSGNNDWMRGKLLQAVGLPNRWRPAPHPDDQPPNGAHQCTKRERPSSQAAAADTKRGRTTQPPHPCVASLPGAAAAASGGSQQQPVVVLVLPGSQLPPWVASQLAYGGASEAASPPATAGFGAAWPPQHGQPLPLQHYGSGSSVTGPPSDPQQQLLVLQAASQAPGATMEQAALTALQALGLLPPGGPLTAGLQPAVVAPQLAGNFAARAHQLPPDRPVLLPPGQVGCCPWPVVLPPSFQEQQAAAEQQWQQQAAAEQQWQQQPWQQQPHPAAANLAGRPAVTAARLASGLLPGTQPLATVQRVAAMPSTAGPSPFAAAASIPLPSSAAESEQGSELEHAPQQAQQAQQHAGPGSPQQAQHGGPGSPAAVGAPAAAAASPAHPMQPSLRLQEDSLMADLKALEQLGWSASFASLPMVSADLEHLFKAWQDGRISLSLAPDLRPPP